MSTAAIRFEELKSKFRALVPPAKRLSRARKRHIAMAANLTQVAEMAVLERACGAGHDRAFIDQMRSEVQAHLAAAGVHKAKLAAASTKVDRK
jgi:hypothetical protein